LNVIAQADAGIALHEEEHRRFRRRVFREFLPLAEAENYGLYLVVLDDRAAQSVPIWA
jgi:hypothetical protein